jgi:hypothetical protein
MSQRASACLASLDTVHDMVREMEPDFMWDEVATRACLLATDAIILRDLTNTIKKLQGGVFYSKVLKSYLKFLFGGEKGNKKRMPIIEELLALGFYDTVLVGLTYPDGKVIDYIKHKALKILLPLFSERYKLASILSPFEDHIRREMLYYAESNQPQWATGKGTSPFSIVTN